VYALLCFATALLFHDLAIKLLRTGRKGGLTDERSLLGWGETLPDGHQENGHGEEGADPQRHFFARFRRDVKYQQS